MNKPTIDRAPDIHRVLITGITGSAGKYFVPHLRENHPQIKIHGTCRRKHLRDPLPGVTLHEADLLDFGSLLNALWESKPDVIFHFAANSDKGFEIPVAILQNNAVGTANLLGAILETRDHRGEEGDPVIVNVSSSEVYGGVRPEDVPITEACPFRPMSPYAVSKVAQDHLGTLYHKAYKLKVINTRAFSYVNVFHKGIFTSAFARQIALIEAGGQPPVLRHGNLDSVRVFVDTQDIMGAYWLAAVHCRPGEAYNIGGDVRMTVGEVLKRMLKLSPSGHRIALHEDPSLLRPADVTLQVPDCSKFIAETGWGSTFDTDAVLKDLLDHYRKETTKT